MISFDLSNLSPKIPTSIKKFDPSYVTRYVILSELIKQSTLGLKQVNILDVGGYNGAIRDILPGMRTTIVDIQEDDKLENYVRVNSTKLPFKDNAFDVVVSSDTLEHIPPEQRKEFITEMVRVSKGYVFIGAPFGGNGVEVAEAKSNAFYVGMTRKDYIWLKEHKEYVLPDRKWLGNILDNLGVHHKSIGHTSVELWENMLRNNFFLAGNIYGVNKGISKKLASFNQYYLDNFAFEDFPKNGYRTFFIISKKADFNVVLPDFDQSKYIDLLVKNMRLLGVSIQNLTREYGTLKANYKNITDSNMSLSSELEQAHKQLASKSYRLTRRIVNTINKLKP